MEVFLQTFFAGLALAVVSALAWLSYRHPGVFTRLFVIGVNLVLSLLILLLVGWNLSFLVINNTLMELVVPDKVETAKAAVSALTTPATWLIWILVGIQVYINFLSWLSDHIEKDRKRQKP